MPPKKHYFRLRYEKLGGHYHCRVFSTTTYNGTWAKLGDLCLGEDEWTTFVGTLQGWSILAEVEHP